MTHREFFDAITELAAGQAHLNAHATAAHAANESNYGRSQLAAQHHNLWGVKATTGWRGATVVLPTWEEVKGAPVKVDAAFRAYPDLDACIADYADIIGRVYPFASKHAASPVAFLAGLFLVGPRKWATDSLAFHKALSILELFDAVAPQPDRLRLGGHALWVDNAPSVRKGLTTITAALTKRPAVHQEAVRATRTRRPDGSFKLDVDLEVSPM